MTRAAGLFGWLCREGNEANVEAHLHLGREYAVRDHEVQLQRLDIVQQ